MPGDRNTTAARLYRLKFFGGSTVARTTATPMVIYPSRSEGPQSFSCRHMLYTFPSILVGKKLRERPTTNMCKSSSIAVLCKSYRSSGCLPTAFKPMT